jgi:hypothetical protein
MLIKLISIRKQNNHTFLLSVYRKLLTYTPFGSILEVV